ncbi:hypothetical protein [uncultured Tateyamaria sp.]|uniref:hypothetical protein n=1 Tax=uncultured Tateyamaria sp. TaxID=455651 RepID=UPI002604F5DF|nr:hypothetical protein [uncultured Tateyamaria sp.]
MKVAPEQSDPDGIDQMLDELAALPAPDPSGDLAARVLADAEMHMPAPDPSGDLAARVLADAEMHMPAPGGRPANIPWWQQIVRGIGGWGAVSGLVAATATGFVIGLGAVGETGVDTLWTLGYDTYYDTDVGLDAFGWAFEEG